MIIERIDLDNIACYRKRSFDFSNLTVVHGENRSGKSTLVYGLFFSLFGTHLNPSLGPADLCRKGSADGSATVFFKNDDGQFQLRRSTAGMPALRRFSPEQTEGSWGPAVSDAAQIDAQVAVPAQVAALTSFFQEGELIIFLREMPKYSRTLLQHVIRMDEIFIVQSRFKKCLALAGEIHGRTQQRLSTESTDLLQSTGAVETVEALERELAAAQRDHQELIRVDGGRPDPETGLRLKRRCETVDREIRNAREARERQIPYGQLAEQQQQLQTRIAQTVVDPSVGSDLHNRMGALSGRISDALARLERLTSLVETADCPMCGQSIPGDRMAESIQRLKEDLSGWEKERESLEKTLSEWNARNADVAAERQRLEEIRLQLAAAERMDHTYRRLEQERAEAHEALALFDRTYPGDAPDAQTRLDRIQESERRLADLQQRLIEVKVALARHIDAEQRHQASEKELRVLERDRLVCHVAHRAVEDAVQSLNRELMSRVRESLSHWTGHFSFLEAFDIGLTPTQLSPIIQAKGYPYKLNQMSKSERIFLYLMLKLAIGDALSHLGILVLDDPADGLDAKRKHMMAELVQKVADRRQILLTTNDPLFAELFPRETRIDLTA